MANDTQKVCNLNFGESEYILPLNENTLNVIKTAFIDKMTPPQYETIEELDEYCDSLIMAIDSVLGEGEANKIITQFKYAGTMEILSIINFIVSIYTTEYKNMFEDHKSTAHIENEGGKK